jgi:ABC-type phosphate transport system substrate-binding protein
MRVVSKIAVAGVSAAALIGIGLGPALADPPAGVTPTLSSVVGVGSQTTQYLLDAIADSYNKTKPPNKLWSWDAVTSSGAVGGTIVTKGSSSTDTTCSITRPNGSSAGIDALATTAKDDGHPCIDYARSSSGPSSSSPSGLVWVGFGEDAVTWTTTNRADGAPASLTASQLFNIYECNTGFRTWKDVGGTGTDKIVPALPQTSSGTRTFFLNAIGNPTLGSCVVNGSIDVPGDSLNPVPLEENTAVSLKNSSGDFYTGNTYFFEHNGNALFPYSVADWIAQQAAPAGGGHATKSFASTGLVEPGAISGVSPVTAGSPDTISTAFTTGAATSVFTRIVYNVVPNVGTTTAPAIKKGSITTIFGPSGVICSDTSLIKSYGFLTLGAECGVLVAGP